MISYFESRLEQANHNLELLNDLKEKFPTDYSDWKVIVSFYTSLHLAHAHVAFQLDHIKQGTYHHYLKKTREIASHIGFLDFINPYTTQGIINAHVLDKSAYRAYEDLYKLSKDARYLESLNINTESKGFSKNRITEQHLRDSINNLNTIRTFVIRSCNLTENDIKTLILA